MKRALGDTMDDNQNMQIEVFKAGLSEKAVIQNMMQLYLYDFSEIEGTELNHLGLFEYNYLDLYWEEHERYPFIIKLNGRLAGFALVNKHAYSEHGEYSIAEFFVLRKYRRQRVGKKAAHFLFNQFPAWWEVRQAQNNEQAQSFWRFVIREYANDDFHEYPNGLGSWDGPVQLFKSRNAL